MADSIRPSTMEPSRRSSTGSAPSSEPPSPTPSDDSSNVVGEADDDLPSHLSPLTSDAQSALDEERFLKFGGANEWNNPSGTFMDKALHLRFDSSGRKRGVLLDELETPPTKTRSRFEKR